MSDKPTEPTAAAMRAGRRIYVEAGKIRRIEEMAKVIDRETGLPELIEALTRLVEIMDQEPFDIVRWPEVWDLARVAIAKAKGKA